MDIERTIEFLLNQQGSTWAAIQESRKDMAELGKGLAELSKDHVELRKDHVELRSLVGRLAQQQLELTQHTDRVQREFGAAILTLAEGQRQLVEAQRHTEERLNALIAVVDDMIRRQPKQ